MTKVRIAELKARLSEYLRKVRAGESVTVLDRDTPVARLVPIDEGGEMLRVRTSRGTSLHEVPLPPPLDLGMDVVEVLLEERQGER